MSALLLDSQPANSGEIDTCPRCRDDGYRVVCRMRRRNGTASFAMRIALVQTESPLPSFRSFDMAQDKLRPESRLEFYLLIDRYRHGVSQPILTTWQITRGGARRGIVEVRT
jgi:hypothetical protein